MRVLEIFQHNNSALSKTIYVSGRDFFTVPSTGYQGYVLGYTEDDQRIISYGVYQHIADTAFDFQGKSLSQKTYRLVQDLFGPDSQRRLSDYKHRQDLIALYKRTVDAIIADQQDINEDTAADLPSASVHQQRVAAAVDRLQQSGNRIVSQQHQTTPTSHRTFVNYQPAKTSWFRSAPQKSVKLNTPRSDYRSQEPSVTAVAERRKPRQR